MQRLKVKLTGNQAEFGSLLFLFGDAWISPGNYYFPVFRLLLHFHCTVDKDSCMPVISVHINVTIQPNY